MRTQARAHDFNDIKPRKLKIGKLTPTIETDKTIAYSFMNNNNIGGMYTTEKREKNIDYTVHLASRAWLTAGSFTTGNVHLLRSYSFIPSLFLLFLRSLLFCPVP